MNCYIYVRCNHFELQYCITTCINPYILTIYNGRNKTRIVLPALLITNIEIEIHYKMFIMFSCQVTVCCVYSCIDINDVLQMVSLRKRYFIVVCAILTMIVLYFTGNIFLYLVNINNLINHLITA